MIDRAACERLDAEDPLASARDLFDLPAGLVYLDGNSLGAMPRHLPARLHEVTAVEWGQDLIRSWTRHGWIDLPRRVGDRIARVLGVEPGSVIACDSTSINLHKVVSAALSLAPRPVILSDGDNFPTDLYVMSNLGEVRLVEPDRVIEEIDPTVGVVVLTHVGYRTGRMHDMRAVTEAANAAGALVVWDLAHSAGAMDLDLGGCDFAVGCGYKYLNGGPGAPSFLYVRPDHVDRFDNPIHGWFGHAAPFEFERRFRPAADIGRVQVGTPPVLSLAALDAALDVFEGIDLSLVRAKSLSLSELLIALVDERRLPLDLITPRDGRRRGSQVCYSHPDGYAIVQALIDEGVVGDFRAPDVIRLGLAPLYVSHVDVWDAVDRLSVVLAEGRHRDPRHRVRRQVT